MKCLKACIIITVIIAGCSDRNSETSVEPDGFVKVPFAQFYWKGNEISTAEFEICDHPVTNIEYKKFTDDTGYPVPLHWTESGSIPEGKEDYPLIFVNRDDAEAYCLWLTHRTGRIYRLPTDCEFYRAARGSGDVGTYYWGDDENILSSGNINYNADGTRNFVSWSDYLRPAKWGIQNSIGLYNMTGNVWQLVETNIDPGVTQYIFRVKTLISLNRTIMGGSWYSTKNYLACGLTFNQSPGIRYPDLGFRLVREPEGACWNVVPRHLCGVTDSRGNVSLSWAALKKDTATGGFNVYRLQGVLRNHSGIRINSSPVLNTSFTDTARLKKGTYYQYRIIELDKSGKETNPSEWLSVSISENPGNVIMKFKPLFAKGGMVPVFGDLEGWNRMGCVVRLDNGNVEMSQDPGVPVQLEAFSSTGRSLWRKDIAFHDNIFGSASNAPFNVWDMNGDGKDEVITLFQIGEMNHVAILEGMTGKLLYNTPWTPMATDFSLSSTRIQMSIAYLDGKNPFVITQTGIYENEIITAYNNRLEKQWEYNSFMETNGSGGHKIEVADVDNDGRDEIIYGTTCLDPDGKMRWSIYRQHPDIISVHDYIPGRPGLEVFYIVESSVNAGVYMVDAGSGELIWKNNREDDPKWSHGHTGWTADIWDGSPGMEAVTNMTGHGDRDFLLFSAEGKKMMDPFPAGYTPAEWDGDETRELLGDNGKVIGDFNGREIVMVDGVVPNSIPGSRLVFSADIAGDFRSELIVIAADTDGRPAVMVITAPDAIGKSFLSPSEEKDYRLWLSRNGGGGYGSVYEYVLNRIVY